MKRKTAKRLINRVIFLAALAIMIVALSKLIPILWDYYSAEKTFQTLQENYVDVVTDPVQESGWAEQRFIDFAALKKENPDIIAWISFDNLKDVHVDYPVLYSGDDDTYLRSDIYGNYHIAGCIFMEGSNSPDFSDYHSIIYGHNMRSSTMFGDLKRYKEREGFYEDNPYFTVYTEDVNYRYQIFSYHDVEEDSDLYTVGFSPGEEYREFIRRLTAASIEDTGIYPKETDKILTLSTCSNDGDDKRFVLHAVCVGEQSNTDTVKKSAEE